MVILMANLNISTTISITAATSKNNFIYAITLRFPIFIEPSLSLDKTERTTVCSLGYLYAKNHLKFRKNQADNLVAVENRFIYDFGADFFFIFWCLALL